MNLEFFSNLFMIFFGDFNQFYYYFSAGAGTKQRIQISSGLTGISGSEFYK